MYFVWLCYKGGKQEAAGGAPKEKKGGTAVKVTNVHSLYK